jgi:hypothetical protein
LLSVKQIIHREVYVQETKQKRGFSVLLKLCINIQKKDMINNNNKTRGFFVFNTCGLSAIKMTAGWSRDIYCRGMFSRDEKVPVLQKRVSRKGSRSFLP